MAPPHLIRAIILGYYLGVRIGESELLKLQWRDFDVDRKRMRVWSAQKNKAQPWRTIDIVDRLYALMLEWRMEDIAKEAEYLVTYKGKPIKKIRTSWATAKRKAGIARELRPYDLRHAFITEAIAAGADLKAVAEIAGHRDTSMIHRTYQHVIDEQKKRVVESIPDILGGVQQRGTKQALLGDFSYPSKFIFQ